MKKPEFIANISILIFFLFFLYESLQLHAIRRFGEVGSGFWPILTLSVATILSLALLFSNFKKYRDEKRKLLPEPANKFPVPKELGGKKKFILSVISLFIYILIMPWIGFIFSTLIFVFLIILALEEKRKFVLTLSPFLVTALIVLIFAKFIGMPLPRGVDFFAIFSRFFY